MEWTTETGMDFAGVHASEMNWDTSNFLDGWEKFKQHAELMFSGPLNDKSKKKDAVIYLFGFKRKAEIFTTHGRTLPMKTRTNSRRTM